MNAKRTILAAIEPLPPGEWLPSIKNAFDLNGYFTHKSKSTLWVWDDVIRSRGRIIYADGAIINRLWLGERRWALSAINKRIYFKEDNISIDNRPEYLIVNGKRPLPPQPQKHLEKLWNILDLIAIGMKQFKPVPVEVEEIDLEINGIIKIFVNNILSQAPASTYNSIYKELGFDFVPAGMEILICPIGNKTINFPFELEDNLKRCLRDRNADCSVKMITLERINRNNDILKNKKHIQNSNKCILFIMPSKVIPPDRDTLILFDELERLGVPFRRAYRDDPYRYSVPNQLPSILLAAGGIPHRSPYHIDGQPIWTVGLDMGHSRTHNFTKMALTLINPDGLLIKAWVALQTLDETIHSEVFQKMLKLCAKELKIYSDNPFVVFLRDGRFFEKDEINFAKEVFGKNLSIFEYRKHLNPQLFYLINGEPTIINKPCAAIVPNSNTIFISTMETYDNKPMRKTAKVTWKEGWNGLEMGPSQIAGLLMQSATAPGLGLQPRLLPASIYWADGIASTVETDLRFRGQPIYKLF